MVAGLAVLGQTGLDLNLGESGAEYASLPECLEQTMADAVLQSPGEGGNSLRVFGTLIAKPEGVQSRPDSTPVDAGLRLEAGFAQRPLQFVFNSPVGELAAEPGSETPAGLHRKGRHEVTNPAYGVIEAGSIGECLNYRCPDRWPALLETNSGPGIETGFDPQSLAGPADIAEELSGRHRLGIELISQEGPERLDVERLAGRWSGRQIEHPGSRHAVFFERADEIGPKPGEVMLAEQIDLVEDEQKLILVFEEL